MNEEDLKNKVLVPLLAEIGISPDDLRFERSFSIQLGRGVHEIRNGTPDDIARGRADILIRAGNENLFIIEVKAPEEKVGTEAGRRQALSYARLMEPMAKAAMVTNGNQTIIYDTITGAKIEDLLNGVGNVDLDTEIRLRYEALQNFVGVSPGNVNAFCDAINHETVNQFTATSSETAVEKLNKKYIPEVFVPRNGLRPAFHDFLKDDFATVFAIIGASGTGKTNAILNLQATYPEHLSLFYSGTILSPSLIQEIKTDFNLFFSPQETELSIWRKFGSIARMTGKPMLLFVDAIDEWMADDKVHQLNLITKVLKTNGIKLCVSCKDTAWSELLTVRGEITIFARSIYIGGDSDDKNAVRKASFFIDNYNEQELANVLKNYQGNFGLTFVNQYALPAQRNPFAIRMKCEYGITNQSTVDITEDSRQVMDNYIASKIRSSGEPQRLERFLLAIAGLMVKKNRLILQEDLIREELGIDIFKDLPDALFVSNFLIRQHQPSDRAVLINFYYSTVRNHLIAFGVLRTDRLTSIELQELVNRYLPEIPGQEAFDHVIKTSLNQTSLLVDLLKCIQRYDFENQTTWVIKLVNQQSKPMIAQLQEDVMKIVYESIYRFVTNHFRDKTVEYQIERIIDNAGVPSLSAFLIQLLQMMNEHIENDHRLSNTISWKLAAISGDEVVQAMQRMISDPSFSVDIRYEMIRAFATMQGEHELVFRQLMLESVQDEKHDVLEYAGDLYKVSETPDLRNDLIDLYDRIKREGFRICALENLGRSQLSDTGPLLFQRYSDNDGNIAVTRNLVRAICDLKFQQGIQKVIDDIPYMKDVSIMETAIISLGENEAKVFIPYMMNYYRNEIPNIDYWWIASTFAKICEPEDLDELAEMLSNPKLRLRNRYAILCTLACDHNCNHNDQVIIGLNDHRFSELERYHLFDYWHYGVLSRSEDYKLNNTLDPAIAMQKLTEDDISGIYKLMRLDDRLVSHATGMLFNCEHDMARLAKSIIAIYPSLKTITERTHLTNQVVRNTKALTDLLSPWMAREFLTNEWKNRAFLQNLIHLAIQLGDLSVYDAILSKRDTIKPLFNPTDDSFEFLLHVMHNEWFWLYDHVAY